MLCPQPSHQNSQYDVVVRIRHIHFKTYTDVTSDPMRLPMELAMLLGVMSSNQSHERLIAMLPQPLPVATIKKQCDSSTTGCPSTKVIHVPVVTAWTRKDAIHPHLL
mmetsp:Transcript_9917/g.20494  ORF Transcript_9917/g.20494 Transcript_9917/m.20494 type:complete len:107 (-) Transcript_9917:695-1015(-)